MTNRKDLCKNLTNTYRDVIIKRMAENPYKKYKKEEIVMDNKILLLLKRVTAILVITVLCSTGIVSAAYEGYNVSNRSGFLSSLLERFRGNKKENQYDLKALEADLEEMQASGVEDESKIDELIGKLPDGDNKDILQGTKDLMSKFPNTNGGNSTSNLLTKLIETVKSLLGGLGLNSSLPTPTTVKMESKTATEFAGDDYKVTLNANIYRKEGSDKWAVLIHPFMLKGKTIANKIGEFYYEKGYNIIAPDLRSFGDSEGKVSLGFLESLDVYDWINLINDEYNAQTIMVHGISLGGATTNFLSGIDGFMNNGPVKMNTTIKSLKELHVIGLTEDCGYTDMTEFANKTMLVGMKIGLTKDNFDYYSQATNSLKYCDLPMQIIHGTGDTTVKPANADTVKNTVKGYSEQWKVDGAVHAFIIMGMNKSDYKTHVQQFITKCENGTNTSVSEDRDEESSKDNTSRGNNGFVTKLLDILKKFKK